MRVREFINVLHNIIEIIEEIRPRLPGHLKRMESDKIPKMLQARVRGERGSLDNGELME